MRFACPNSTTTINGHHHHRYALHYHHHHSLFHWQLPDSSIFRGSQSSLSRGALPGHPFCDRRPPSPPPSPMGLLQPPPQHEGPAVDDRLPFHNSLANHAHAPLRVLCLHGFRTSGDIMQRQLHKWDRSVLDLLDPVYLDAPFPALGKSDVEGIFPPPYYEWFQFERTETNVTYSNLEECIEFISDYMEKHGPFDGLIGFSQGAFLSAALAGMQQQGLALTSVPPLRFVIIISGGVLRGEHKMKGCYSEPIICPALHLVGENDFLKPQNEELVAAFKDPVVIRHGARHTVPRLGAEELSTIRNFLHGIKGFKGGEICESIEL